MAPPTPPPPPGMMNIVVSKKAVKAPAPARSDLLADIAKGSRLKAAAGAAAAAAAGAMSLNDVIPDIGGGDSGGVAFPRDPRLNYLRAETAALTAVGKRASVTERIRLTQSKKEFNLRKAYLDALQTLSASPLGERAAQLAETIYRDLDDECRGGGGVVRLVYWNYKYDARFPNEYYEQRDMDLLQIALAAVNNSAIVDTSSYRQHAAPLKRCEEEHASKVARLTLEKQLTEAATYEDALKLELAQWKQEDEWAMFGAEFLRRLQQATPGDGAEAETGAQVYKRVRTFMLAKWQSNRQFELLAKGPKMPQIWTTSLAEQARHPEILEAVSLFAGGTLPMLRRIEETGEIQGPDAAGVPVRLDDLVPGWRDWQAGSAPTDGRARVTELEAQLASLRSQLLLISAAPANAAAPSDCQAALVADDTLEKARREIERLESELRAAHLRPPAAAGLQPSPEADAAAAEILLAQQREIAALQERLSQTRDIYRYVHSMAASASKAQQDFRYVPSWRVF